MNNSNNPIVQEVVSKYKTIESYARMFISNPDSAIRGLLISGDAGFGKTHYTRLGLASADRSKVDYIKGSSITAAALYVKLYQSRNEGDVLVLDDVDIINKTRAEFYTILDLIKGATEPEKDREKRTIAWERANNNALMKENEVPSSFEFNGSIIWITNESIENIAKKAGSHWGALDSRFYKVQAWLDEKEMVMYTLFLVEDIDMLGKECYAKEDGYTQDVVEKTTNYLRTNWKYMSDYADNCIVSPRTAIKLADTICNFPDNWKEMADVQFIKL